MRERAQAWLPAAWAAVLALVLLGPALAPGFVLTYDMVWVPDLAVRPDVWGLGSGLPRAVPSDAVVALLDELVPGALLQKLVLVGFLVAGGAGIARLVPGPPTERRAVRLVAVSAYVWTPFVAERLLLGAWPVLVAHALLPWLVLLGRRWRVTGRAPAALLVLVPLGCLSASAGLATAVVLLAAVAGPRRPTLRAVALLVAANAPWLVTGLLHAADATSDRAGAEAFALQGHGTLPTPLEALALGGTWNSEVVLPSRDGILAWVGLVLLAALLLAVRGWWAATSRREALTLVVPWAFGLSLALLTWVAPGAVAWLAATVPGGGLVRDGARSLVLCAPLVAVLAAHAAARVAARVVEEGPRLVLAGALALVPVMLMPDATFGLASRLEAVDYPASYAVARKAAAGVPGDALVLPLSSYRQPRWNGGRKVLDPLPRWLTSDVVASDRLVVGTTVLQGEDPRVSAAADALAESTPEARAAALADLGFGVVVVELDAGEAPEVAGRVLLDGDLRVLALDRPDVREVPAGWAVAAVVAWSAYAAGPALALVLVVRRRRSDQRR
ncbi:hypothetical protein [Nocardioides sp.]|uniref:hypothetical protein n=1 Tax=Nocardioides sp. TaxID=35761 RepID=UPI0027160629|nr:hypothetical protein [Nocardioides sp.]MDO9455309.1 hypothetical protein [Nocardioides sp.]